MSEEELDVTALLKGSIRQVLGDEMLFIEAVRDLIKEEIKEHLRKKIENDPELKEELKKGFMMYYEGKMRELLGGVIIAKAGTKLALESIPEDIKKEVSEELQKELMKLVDETL
ncbi:MAG: hypothetical protein J7K08_00835 [Thermoplasmata archaeon]|nr:hypothetical protein [Thermoplasmata archaeon]RLF71070.1 MAG: hypothetical protein DRN35_03125 [Thermoplasmata archaeon]RLF71864.1 MAG: hypothetical protein DRN55_06880 [Thermoplasmata archaeon]RLF75427.1 MAG: hypothetical protein DRN42_02890 [Thermoplasmata archaeon]HDD60712.1 hypothetical protein [Euryarchaeota archaeon]